jgi:hypothetical protein
MAGNDEDRGKSGRLGAEDRRWSSTGRVLGGQTIETLGDAVCGVHHAQGDEERGFLGLSSKPRSPVSPVWPQNRWLRFLGLELKTKWAMVCRLRYKTDRRMKTAWDTCRDLVACFV